MIQLLNDPLDCDWLRNTHLRKLDPIGFKSFEICGNEDTPTCVKTYLQIEPTVFDLPVETFLIGPDHKLTKAVRAGSEKRHTREKAS